MKNSGIPNLVEFSFVLQFVYSCLLLPNVCKLMGANPSNMSQGILKQIVLSYIHCNPTIIGSIQITSVFPYTFCMCIIKKPSESLIFGSNVYANAFLRIW